MKHIVLASTFGMAHLLCAQAPRTVPLYQVTVIERTTQAVNYQYRSGPTPIDFKGTVLMPHATGEATVESRRGGTEIDAKFEHVTAPTQFGREYLTYVLWAITPQGAAKNLGEVVPNGSDKAKLHVTSDLQVFGMIVTAEPYAAVRKPSDVVVLENQVRPETAGIAKPIDVKHELLPRGHFTWQVPEKLQDEVANSRKVSMDEYEALSNLYQAENAIGIARAAGADRYAPETFAKAQRALADAQQLRGQKGREAAVVQHAREAAQTAEDARVLAEKRAGESQSAAAESEVAAARQAQQAAQAQTQQALAEANAAREQLDAERAARRQAEEAAAAVRAQAAQAPQPAPALSAPPARRDSGAGKMQLRRQLLQEMSGAAQVRDTPRGLVVIFPDSAFHGSILSEDGPATQLSRIASLIAVHPELRIDVEGHALGSDGSGMAMQRAEGIRSALIRKGLPSSHVAAKQAVDSGRGGESPRRVEIVIWGDAIGDLASWDRSYPLY